MKDIYIKSLIAKFEEHKYEIKDFKMTDREIKFKKDDIYFYIELTPELKLKIIEILLLKKTKSNNQKFYYNEPYKKGISNENEIKMLKIQDNIISQRINKLSIYCNRLSKENRDNKVKIGKLIGINLGEEISYNDLIIKLRTTFNNLDPHEKKQFRYKSDKLLTFNENSKINNNEIEEKEIIKICGNKMKTDMEDEIHLINLDIVTLRKERDIIEKENNDKKKEFQDLLLYLDTLKINCNKINNEAIKKEEEEKKVDEDLKIIFEEKNNLDKYLYNLKNKGRANNKNGISKKIKDLEKENNKIVKEIKEKNQIIANGNKEIEELNLKIRNLEAIIKKQK